MKYIVSDQHKFVYFVNQKAACSSIKLALLHFFPIDPEEYVFINWEGIRRVAIHRAFDESEFQIEKDDLLRELQKYGGYFKFGFVRNPWDRLVSCFVQKLNPHKPIERADGSPLRPPLGDKSAFYPGMPFEEFVERVHQVTDAEADVHFRSQAGVFYRDDEGGTCLADFIGRFETLAEDFQTVTKRLGLAEPLALPRELESRNGAARHFRSFYNERTRKLAAERYEVDISLFGYRF